MNKLIAQKFCLVISILYFLVSFFKLTKNCTILTLLFTCKCCYVALNTLQFYNKKILIVFAFYKAYYSYFHINRLCDIKKKYFVHHFLRTIIFIVNLHLKTSNEISYSKNVTLKLSINQKISFSKTAL